MKPIFERCLDILDRAAKEYAYTRTCVFENFNRAAKKLGLERHQIVLVFANKHFDGISAYTKGHKEQRESFENRCCDLINYLCLLRLMREFKTLSVPDAIKLTREYFEGIVEERQFAEIDTAMQSLNISFSWIANCEVEDPTSCIADIVGLFEVVEREEEPNEMVDLDGTVVRLD